MLLPRADVRGRWEGAANTVTNTGTVSLGEASIADELPGMSEISYTWRGEAGVLAAGEQVTATASYMLTDADPATNQATATGPRRRAPRRRTATRTSSLCPARRP